MKYLLIFLIAFTTTRCAEAAPSPFIFGNNFHMQKSADGACAIWWDGDKYYGGCEAWDKWPGNWFEIVQRLQTGTDAERTADYESFGCTPGPQDCSRLPVALQQIFVDLWTATKPPAAVYKVKSSTTGFRPYYKPNATMTGYGTKLGDVAVGTLCDGTKRLGDSLYYLVPSVSTATKPGYSLCELVK
jgi:hypothetical protein